MKRTEIREFIRKGCEAISPAVEFSFGQLTDWNAVPNKTYPHVLFETIKNAPISTELPHNTIPSDSVPILLRICKIDKMDSLPEVYEQLIDSCDNMAQRLIYQYNNLISGYKTTTIKGIKREPFIKAMAADCLTGVTLRFNLDSQDKTDVCDDDGDNS